MVSTVISSSPILDTLHGHMPNMSSAMNIQAAQPLVSPPTSASVSPLTWFSNMSLFRVTPVSNSDMGILYTTGALSVAVFYLYVFQNTIVSWLPRWLRPFAQEEDPREARRRTWSHWTLMLAIICITGFVLSIVPVCLPARHHMDAWEILPWSSAVFLTAFDRPIKTPKLLLVQYLLILMSNLTIYSTKFLSGSLHVFEPLRLTRMLLCCIAILLIANMPLRDPTWGVKDIGNPGIAPSHHVRSPEDNLSIFRFLAMSWVYPIAKLSLTREIDEEDVWQLPFDFQHKRLYMAFRELKGKLLICLIEANGLDLFISTVLAVVERVAEVSNIRLTSKLYKSLDIDKPNEALFWVFVILTLDFTRQLSKTTSSWYCRKAYERSRGETFIALFGKLLTRAVPGSDSTEQGPPSDIVKVQEHGLDDVPQNWFGSTFSTCFGLRRTRNGFKATQVTHSSPASNAKVVNLVRGDTYEISQRFWEFPKLIAQPIKVFFTMYYLIDIMGWPSSVGFGLMIIFFSINSMLVKKLIKIERERTAHSDKRAQAVSHFVEASRPLKLNGWTASWSDRIMRFRALELVKRLQIAHVSAAISTISVTGGAAYPFASICLYTLVLRQGLPNDVIWPSLQLFGQLETSVKEAFDLVAAYWKATIPVDRVNKYMNEPDRDQASLGTEGNMDIEFQDAWFSWPSTAKPVLEALNLKFSTGLTIVRGQVGSGKSSLLLAALNEMELHDGHLLRPDEAIAYAQQLPWLQNKTIRENIVFNQPFDADRYREVLYACALGQDLSMFPDGDQMKLEEGGVGLSGGQKARVALARAVYSRTRILLLDDPLAPLDHDTASIIVQRFLLGSLAKDRTIVMVTHRDDLVLRVADQVIDMDNGRAHVLSPEEIQSELEHPYHAPSEKEAHDDSDQAHEINAEEIASMKEAPEEASETGTISPTVYLKYMRAGGWKLWTVLALSYILSRVCDIARARLLEAWGSMTAEKGSHSGYLGLPNPEQYPQSWLYVLAGLSVGQILAYAIAQLLLARIGVNAARGLFQTAVDKVSKATFRYHDTTPTGQLKNRLIADMAMVDGGITGPLESFVFNLIALILSVIAIAMHQPMLLIILVLVAALFIWFFRIYIPVSRCLRRMEMRYLTPIISNIGVMQDGLVTIRALRVEKHFQDRHLDAVDDFQKQDHFYWSMAFWLDFRLSMTSAVMRAALITFMICRSTPASVVGFVLTQTTMAMGAVQQLCEKVAQLQLDAVSLERVEMLNKIPEEPTGDDYPPDDWPRPCDDVKFEGMSFKYADDLPAVLEKISFEIPGGSTCAVLGRTGSGKSTIANALLVTQAPCEGTIKVGSVDLSKVDRTALRNRITFIQQDPTLFPGTLRDNIDPEGKFSDSDCEASIHRVLGSEWSLDTQIDAAGKNLSQGQRQLVGIARAVLRRSGLVILDEATASIDRATAAKVQKILRSELASSTVITIAHRLEAVEDANWCLRLHHGRVVECGPAKNLGRTKGQEVEGGGDL